MFGHLADEVEGRFSSFLRFVPGAEGFVWELYKRIANTCKAHTHQAASLAAFVLLGFRVQGLGFVETLSLLQVDHELFESEGSYAVDGGRTHFTQA